MKKITIAIIFIILIAIVGVVISADIKPISLKLSDNSTITSLKSDIRLTSTESTFIDRQTKMEVKSSINIGTTKFIPELIREEGSSVIYESGFIDTKTDKSVISVKYTATDGSLKEEITITQDMDLSFPITLSKGTKLIPWFNGEYKIVSSTSTDTMNGIVASKPFGIDASGNYVDMNYRQDGNTLSLVYERQTKKFNITLFNQTSDILNSYDILPIIYPLVIDPTWTSVYGYYQNQTGNDIIVKFNTTGTIQYTVPVGITNLQYLVVAGGAGGGGEGAGGAGGLLTSSSLSVLASRNLTILVGSGGAYNADGTNSSIVNTTQSINILSIGGGRGGSSGVVANNGGSGGGSSYGGSRGSGTVGQGNIGGFQSSHYGGGGGGSGSVGYDASSSSGGNGGSGTLSTITSESLYYAAGGGGAGFSTDSGGSGGSYIGGNGIHFGTSNATGGINGTGSGGGGGGGTGGSGIIVLRYTIPYVDASFTKNSTGGLNSVAVQFNDTTTNTPTAWNWYFNNITGNSTDVQFSTSQNPSKAFNIGNYSIKLYASNAYGGDWYNLSSNINVIGNAYPVLAFTSNITSGITPLVVQFYDNSTNYPTSWLWSFDDGTTSTEQNPIHTFVSVGTFDTSLNASNSYGYGTVLSKTNYITTTDSTLTGMGTMYAPHTVKFIVKDRFGHGIPYLDVSVTSEETSMGSWDWLKSLFGITSSVPIQTSTMQGHTGEDGAISFIMFESIGYNLHFTNTTTGIDYSAMIYPQESEILISIKNYPSIIYPQSKYVSFNITEYQNANNSITLKSYFQDNSSTTISTTFWVRFQNGTAVYSSTIPNPTSTSFQYTLPYTINTTYIYGLTTISSVYPTSNTTKVYSFPTFIDLEIPSEYYSWISAAILLLFCAIFSRGNNIFGVIIIPAMASFLIYIGWLPMAMGATVSILLILGVLLYMKARSVD